MNPKSLFVLCVVIVLPLASFFIIKYYSDDAVNMPRRFYADSIISKITDGKKTSDTVWHKVSNITLTNQLGKTVSLNDLNGKVIIADFFFTSCPIICPKLTRNMKKLQDALKVKNDKGLSDYSFVQFLSFTVDPQRDSVTAIKKYADKYGVNPDSWWMLTGPKKTIYDFAINELKLGVSTEDVDNDFIHPTRLVLLDRERVVRGYYDGLDSTALSKLAEDLIYVVLEKDKKKKRNLFRK